MNDQAVWSHAQVPLQPMPVFHRAAVPAGEPAPGLPQGPRPPPPPAEPAT